MEEDRRERDINKTNQEIEKLLEDLAQREGKREGLGIQSIIVEINYLINKKLGIGLSLLSDVIGFSQNTIKDSLGTLQAELKGTKNELKNFSDRLGEASNEIKESSEQTVEHTRTLARWTRVLAGITFFYTLAAICLSYFSYDQGKTMKKSVSISETALKETINSSRLDQRAWVGPFI